MSARERRLEAASRGTLCYRAVVHLGAATMSAVAPLTLDAFLAWEESQPERFELVGGVVRMMAGGTEDHDRIGLNIATALRTRLRGTPCFAHGSNLKVLSRDAGASMYPDVFVRCGARDGRRTRTDDPVIAFEVLSEGTARYDLTRKRLAYEAISSLRRIIYVAVEEPRIDMRVRGADGIWRDETVEGLDAVLLLPEIDASLPLREIYEDSEVAAGAASGAG
jgi:Uma2 family endonuclease